MKFVCPSDSQFMFQQKYEKRIFANVISILL